jgi:protein phosphatase
MTEHAATTSAAPSTRFVVRAVLRTDVGLVRSENQDFGTYTTSEEEREGPGGRLLVVADGMGGHRGGATASKLAGETVKAQFLGSETDDLSAALREALDRANRRIYSEAQANPDLRGMGTTTSALAVRGGHGWFAHVGDSRIYQVRGEEITQLTDDHSIVAAMVREGLLTSKEAETHPRRNVLQRSMGVAEDVDIDVKGPFAIQEGDVFILCSDGLHGLVKDDELKEVARLPIEQAADEYLKRSLDRGAPDNVTVIVAKVERAPDVGDETLADEPFEETQPVAAADPLLFDETVKEVREVDLSGAPPPPAASDVAEELAPPAPTAAEGGGAALKDAPPAKRSSGILKFIILVVLALGAAGAWIFWNANHNQGIAGTTQPSAR